MLGGSQPAPVLGFSHIFIKDKSRRQLEAPSLGARRGGVCAGYIRKEAEAVCMTECIRTL